MRSYPSSVCEFLVREVSKTSERTGLVEIVVKDCLSGTLWVVYESETCDGESWIFCQTSSDLEDFLFSFHFQGIVFTHNWVVRVSLPTDALRLNMR